MVIKIGRIVLTSRQVLVITSNSGLATPLKIGINYQLRPYIIRTENGIELDIVSTILRRLNLPHQYYAFSLNRAQRSLESAKMDISLTSIFKNNSALCSSACVYYSNVAISLK